MSAITINGVRVTSASVTIPTYGAWSADVVIDSQTVIADAVTLVLGDLTLVGTVRRKSVFGGAQSARIVGGGGGWRKTLPAKGYSQEAGVKLSLVLNDAAREAGETITVSPDRVIGTAFAREEAKAEEVLALTVGRSWWIDPAGRTQIVARSSAPITSPFTIVSHHGNVGRFEVATEAISSWQPGRTFTAPTVSGTQTISSVSIVADNTGKLRIVVLNTSGETERLRTDLRSMIRAEVSSLSYAGVYEYEIAASVGAGLVSTVDCTPTDPTMPPLTKVPIFGMGVVAPPAAGTTCRIRFVNSDPTRPECIAFAGMTEHLVTTEAMILFIYNTLASWCVAAGGGPLMAAVLQPLIVPSLLLAATAQSAPAPPGLVAQVALNATLGGTMAAGTTPSPALGPLAAALSLLSTKTLDVSGLFPSMGVPSGP